MEYISNELVLPVPLNLVRIPRAVIEYCCEGCNQEVEEEVDENDVILNGKSFASPPITKNGVEVKSATVLYRTVPIRPKNTCVSANTRKHLELVGRKILFLFGKRSEMFIGAKFHQQYQTIYK